MNYYDPKKLGRVISVMNYMEGIFTPYYKKYSKQIDKYYTQLIKELVKNELLGSARYEEKKEKISTLVQKEYVTRTLEDLSDFPITYRTFFWLIKKQRFAILNIGYILYKKIKK